MSWKNISMGRVQNPCLHALRLFRLLFQFLLLQHELVMRHLPQQQTWALRGKSLDCWLQNEPFKHVTSLATFACSPNLVLTDLRIFFLTRSGCISYPWLFDLIIMIQHEWERRCLIRIKIMLTAWHATPAPFVWLQNYAITLGCISCRFLLGLTCLHRTRCLSIPTLSWHTSALPGCCMCWFRMRTKARWQSPRLELSRGDCRTVRF